MSSKKYTYEEVKIASTEYFDGDELAGEVFASKYALRDLQGNIYEKTPADMHSRMAKEFSRIEAKYDNSLSEDQIFQLFNSGKVYPQGSPMSAIGNPYQVQSLSNCFVLEAPYDSYGGICKTDQEQVQIMKRRGGVGFDISNIRPKGMITANAARTTDGIGVFMERFSNTTREVAQGGRRGALMLSISVHHPEIRTFAQMKMDREKVTGANISIRVTDEFMQAVKDGTQVQLRFPVDRNVPSIYEESVDARELFTDIVTASHDCAEPGVLFWDTVKKYGPADAYEKYGYGSVSTNPCGEITLSPYDSCRLLLVNLTKFVSNPFTDSAQFDYESFDKTVQQSQRLMDDLIDLELEAVDKIITKVQDDPEPEDVKRPELDLWKKIKNAATNGRRTGLGITGLGDAIAMLGVRYSSPESIALTHDIYRGLALGSYRSSVRMAKERGPFPVYSYEVEKDNEFLNRIMAEDGELAKAYKKYGRRNIANTTTAPAGSVSILARVSSGCEPVFKLHHIRKKKINANDDVTKVDSTDQKGDKWQHFDVYHYMLNEWAAITGKSISEYKESPYHGACAEEIEWVKKIDMQAAAQKWICHSISNTTNLPEDVELDIVKELYMHGWESECKGVTIYRKGSRDAVLSDPADMMTEDGLPLMVTENHAPKRPLELPCDIHRASVKGEKYVVLVGLLDGKPYELFCGLSEHIEVPKKSKTGTLIKNGKINGVST
jgi:ribonucleoside-diphosphate reductase alpha chain